MKNWIAIKPDNKLLHILLYIFATAVVVLMTGLLLEDWKISALCGIILIVTLEFRITINKDMPAMLLNLFSFVASAVIFYLMQLTINSGVSNIGIIKLILNILIVFGIISLLWLITSRLKASIIATIVITQIIGVANNIVSTARGMEIQYSDLKSIGTAAEVADRYSFSLNGVTSGSLLISAILIAFISLIKFQKSDRTVKKAVFSLGGILVAVTCVILVYTRIGAPHIGYVTTYWDFSGSLYNGFFVNFINSASASQPKTPEGYNVSFIRDQTEAIISSDENIENSDYPNVIVIMNESFSDIHNLSSYFGKEMETNVDIMPFFDSLDDSSPNIFKGHSLTSAYGGNTASAEYEFLSGLSLQFFPRNSVAYNIYINESNSFTVVDNFRYAGYETVSIHPEKPTNWKRNTIYELFGFDSSYFIDDFNDCTDDDRFRGHISDMAVYDKIIELYENKDASTPLFNFTVTMQNHGGYLTDGFEPTVTVKNKNNSELNEYLSCVNNSDYALKRLIEYFEKEEEKTVILFFGDHQPAISSVLSDYFSIDKSSPLEEEAKYVVPYLFYANYDIECADATKLTSLNFLSTWLIDIAGIPESGYNKCIKKINGEILAINATGWFDYDYNFHQSDYNYPELTPTLKLYSHLQYNFVFDNEERLLPLFTFADDN